MSTRRRAVSPLSSTLWRSLAEEASDGLFVTDAAFCLLWVNQRACELLRRPLDALVGHCIPEFFWDPDELKKQPLRSSDLLAGRSTITLRPFRTGDGERRIFEVSAKRIGGELLVGLARDVTDRLLTTERLERSEASFRALAEQSPESIIVHAGGKMLYINRAAAITLGFDSPQAAIGSSLIGIVHPDDRAGVQRRLQALEKGDTTLPFIEERFVRRDGTQIIASVGAVKVVFEGTPAIAAIGRDVTQQRALDAEYAQNQKMASIGLLAAGVAHEVNNPLAYVLLRIQAMATVSKRLAAGLTVIRAGLAGGTAVEKRAATAACEQQAALLSELEDHVETALEGAEKVRTIVHDLRVFSRLDRDDRSVVDVIEPLERALSIVGHGLGRRARIVRDFADTPPVLASPGKLTLVFLNLLLNASAAIPEGRMEDNEVRVSVRLVDRAVHVAISDTGCGVAPDDLRRLFEPFFTARSSSGSTGLGLAICHGIVTAHGGTIRVESKLGLGTTFTVSLPEAPGGD